MEFDNAIQALCDAEVEFVLIGGVCAALHGSARITYDLDVCYSRKSSNLCRLADALAPFHPKPRGLPEGLPFVWDYVTLRNGTVFTLKTDLGDIDLLGELAGVGTYDEAKLGSVIVEAFGRQIAILDLRSLIQSKRAAGREKDLSDIRELESLLEASED